MAAVFGTGCRRSTMLIERVVLPESRRTRTLVELSVLEIAGCLDDRHLGQTFHNCSTFSLNASTTLKQRNNQLTKLNSNISALS